MPSTHRGRPAPAFEKLESGCLGFRATELDGPSVDLVALSGISPSEKEHDALTECVWQEVVIECGGTIIETLDFEGAPGQSDTFYDIEVDDTKKFVENLRSYYLSFLKTRNRALRTSAERASAKADRCVTVTVEWGYELHHCPMAKRTWRRILKGAFVRRVEPYIYDAQRFTGEWHFNHNGFGTLLVTYDDSGVGFDGDLSEAIITICDEPVHWNEIASKSD